MKSIKYFFNVMISLSNFTHRHNFQIMLNSINFGEVEMAQRINLFGRCRYKFGGFGQLFTRIVQRSVG